MNFYEPEKHIIFLFVPIFAVVDRGNAGLAGIFFSVIVGRVIAEGAMAAVSAELGSSRGEFFATSCLLLCT